jgi:hypothetical protein
VFICCRVALTILLASAHAGTGVPFTPEGIASLRGKDVCSLEGDFPTQLGVDLDRHKAHAVQYRERDGVVAVFLLSRPTERCGVVDAALNLTPLVKPGENLEFKCYTGREGGDLGEVGPHHWARQ